MGRRTDDNQKQIVDNLRKLGYKVLILSQVGKGVPDLLVAKNGQMLLVEVKDSKKPLSQQRLTPDEVKFHAQWSTYVVTCNSLEQVMQWI